MLRQPLSNMSQSKRPYIGRFAPSPTGPLHFGSLVCALASFLHAKQAGGKWLVRIEDIDTQRCSEEMTRSILNALLAHGMQWDVSDEPSSFAGLSSQQNNLVSNKTIHDFPGVSYQSTRSSLYEETLARLKAKDCVYACSCSRKEISMRAAYYDRHCRELGLEFDHLAIRWKNDAARNSFTDLHLGKQSVNERMAKEDPVLKRADGLYGYHLAVVADDIEQGITHIVRGADLIETTPLHISLFEALGALAPSYLHIPLAAETPGQKLSKQNLAPAIENDNALSNIKSALAFLGAAPEAFKNVNEIDALLDWAITHWQIELLPSQTEILVLRTNNVYCVKNPSANSK
jgi:glutamyl-Q tRNA(Asp) synthetase